MLITSIFSFFHNFFFSIKNEFYDFSRIQIVVCRCFEVGQSFQFFFLSFGKELMLFKTGHGDPSYDQQLLKVECTRYDMLDVNSFPNKPWFSRVCNVSLLKTLWKKEKLLVMSNFSFSHCVFFPFWKLSAIFIIFELLSANSFSFKESQFCRCGNG